MRWYPGTVPLDLRGRALAPVTRIPEVTTGARVFLFTVPLELGQLNPTRSRGAAFSEPLAAKSLQFAASIREAR